MSNFLEMSRKTFITWEEVECFIDWLVQTLNKDNKHYIGVYGIPRGGLIFAVILSYRLNIPLLTAPYENCLVIDEISATGTTLKSLEKRYDIATMHYYYKSEIKPLYFYKTVVDEWIVYPWE